MSLKDLVITEREARRRGLRVPPIEPIRRDHWQPLEQVKVRLAGGRGLYLSTAQVPGGKEAHTFLCIAESATGAESILREWCNFTGMVPRRPRRWYVAEAWTRKRATR